MIRPRRILLGMAAAFVLVGCGSRAPGSAAPAPAPPHRLVYVTQIGGINGKIVIAGVDGSNPHRLTSGFEPRISPDGRWVAFIRCFACKPDSDVGRTDLYVIASDGGQARLLVKDVRAVEWAPNSKMILTGHADALSAVTLTGERRTLAASRSFRADFSPDGRTVVFDRAQANASCGNAADLFTVPTAGGQPRLLTRNGAFPVWRAQSIAFVRDVRADCTAHTIWIVRPDGSGARSLVSRLPRSMSQAGYYGLSPVAWLSGGRRLLASIDNEFGNEAAVIDVSTGGLRRLGAPVAAVSRDGRWIVGQTGGAELPFSIVIAPVAGGGPRTVAHGRVCCPDWNR